MPEEGKTTLSVADPAPLGLGGFALTTFILSGHNAFGAAAVSLLAFFGYAIFYGGLAQFMAGMYEFRNRNTFGATAFTTYGAFWMGLAAFVGLLLMGKVQPAEVAPSLGWILLAFAIFNTYMLLWSTRINCEWRRRGGSPVDGAGYAFGAGALASRISSPVPASYSRSAAERPHWTAGPSCRRASAALSFPRAAGAAAPSATPARRAEGW